MSGDSFACARGCPQQPNDSDHGRGGVESGGRGGGASLSY